MFYLKFGLSKQVVVYLHGWGADKNSFLWVKPYFEKFTNVFVDFPGFGDSKEPDKSWNVESYAKELKNLIDEIDVEELVLVGHSFGGRVAIKFAKLYQKEYLKLKICLVDSAGLKPKRGLSYYFKVWRYKILKSKSIRNPELKNKLCKFGSEDYKLLSPTMKQVFVNVVNENLKFDAKQICVPTILIWGENDNDTKLCMAKKLNKLIKNSKLYVLKDAGHFSFLDKPQEFLIILDRFLQN